MIDPTFKNIIILILLSIDCLFKNLSFKNGNDDPTRNSFDEYKCYMQLVEIKHFNGLIDNKPFFD